MVHSHTVHLPLGGALLSPCAVCVAQVVYFVQGVLGLAALARTYFMKDTLGLSPAEVGAWATHGALPHRAPPPRCTAEPMHHVWYRSAR